MASRFEAVMTGLKGCREDLDEALSEGRSDLWNPQWCQKVFSQIQLSEGLLRSEHTRWKRYHSRDLMDDGVSQASVGRLVGVSNRRVKEWTQSPSAPIRRTDLRFGVVDDDSMKIGVGLAISGGMGISRTLEQLIVDLETPAPYTSPHLLQLTVATPSPTYEYYLARTLAGLHLRGATLGDLASGVGKTASWVKSRIAGSGAHQWLAIERQEKENTP